METVQLGSSKVKITRVAFGAWAIGGWMWGGSDRKEAERALEASVEMGITSIDTAPAYGFGLSEEIVGEVVRYKRDKVQILTKYGLRWDITNGSFYFPTRKNDGTPVNIYRYAGKESIISECEMSLKRLRTDHIDLYQIHWPDPTTAIEETMEAVDRLIRNGKVLAAGVSNYSADELNIAMQTIPVASNQVAYSMVNRGIEEELVPYCQDHNVGILAYSPLQRGILTGKFKPGHRFGPGDSRPDTYYYKKNNIEKINDFLNDIRTLADGKNASLAQIVLRWTLQMPGITAVLAGIRNQEQLRENAGALSFTLSDEEMEFINTKLAHVKMDTR